LQINKIADFIFIIIDSFIYFKNFSN
jgi:hypothetical protein